MSVQIKQLPKSEVELTITVPYEVYKKWEKKAFEELSKEIKVPGFRAGHIPENIIRERVSEAGIKSATLDFVLPQTYAAAVTENKIQVVARPKIDIKSDIKKEGDDFVYVATVAVMPEAKVGDYKKIKVARVPVKVEKENIDKTIELLLSRFAEWKDVERKAKKGDRVEADFEGFDEAGKAIENTASKNHPIILGGGNMIPGFEDAIIGMAKGEIKEFDITFPKEYHAKAMQGRKVKFKLSVGRIEEKLEKPLDEAMIEKVTGKKMSVEEFRKAVEEDLKSEMQVKADQEHDGKVVDEILKITKAEVPEALIEEEINQMLHEQKTRVAHQGLKWEDYLKHINKTEEDFRKDHKKGASDRIVARLGVQHIIRDAKLEVSDEEVAKKVDEIIARYPKEQQSQVRDHYEKEPDAKLRLRHNLSADKLIDMLSK